jgi:hypothetical protein
VAFPTVLGAGEGMKRRIPALLDESVVVLRAGVIMRKRRRPMD